MSRLPYGWLVFLLILLTLIGCGRRSAPGEPVRLVVGGNASSLALLPHTLAQELKLYEKERVKVTVEIVPGGNKALQALLGGSADVVVGYYEHTIRMAAQGQALRSFVTMTRYPGNVLVVSPRISQSKRTVEDLKHSFVGVSDLGSQGHFFLNFVLSQHGVSPRDVTAVSMGGSLKAGVAALEHGKVDAWSGFEPGVAQLQKRNPAARILADARTEKGVREVFGADAYPGSVLYTRADWLGRNPDTARKLAHAIQGSLRWIHEHSANQIADKMPTAYIGDDGATYRQALANSMPMYSLDGRMPAHGPETARKALGTSLENVRTAQIDLAKTYTDEFLAQE
jgi:NitT/TauT family transport system substrate-binding protein